MAEESPLTATCPARYACVCGHRAEYRRAESIEFLRYQDIGSLVTADCPACGEARPTKTLDMGTIVCVAAGEFIEAPHPESADPPIYRDVQNSTFEGVPNPIAMTEDPFDPRCQSCDAVLDETHRREGPEAPEVGWEYYECPECDEKTRADSASLGDRV